MQDARCATGSFRSIQPFFFFPHSILSLSLSRTHTPEYPGRVARNTLPPPWLRIRNLDIALGKALLPNCRDIADPLFSLFLEHEWKIGKDAPRSIYLFPPLWCGFSERLSRVDRTKFFPSIRSSFLLYCVIIIFRFIRDVIRRNVGWNEVIQFLEIWKFGNDSVRGGFIIIFSYILRSRYGLTVVYCRNVVCWNEMIQFLEIWKMETTR